MSFPTFKKIYFKGGIILSEIIAREGFTKIPNFIFNLGLTPTEFSTLAALYQHLPNVNPSVTRLAKMVGVSRPTINRIFRLLENKNLMGRIYKNGARTIYLLHKDYKSFIAKKLSTKAHEPLSPMITPPLSSMSYTPITHDKGPLSPMITKQYKEQYKKQENEFLIFENEKSEEAIEARRQFVMSLFNKEPED